MALPVASAKVAPAPAAAHPLPTEGPSAGQPQAVPVGTTPATWQFWAEPHALSAAGTKTQPLASAAQWPNRVGSSAEQKSPSIAGWPQRASFAHTQAPSVQVWWAPQ